MKYTKVCREMRKLAAGLLTDIVGKGAYLLGALVVANLALQGAATGYLVSAAGSPGAYDMLNILKLHRLARINRDILTQRILQQRQQTKSKLLAPLAKTMRIS